MKKLLALAMCGMFGAGMLQAASSSYDDCMFCGIGTPTVPSITPATPATTDCVFCGGSSSSSGGSSSSVNWTKAMSFSTYVVNDDGSYAGLATFTTSKKSKKNKVSVKVVFKMANNTKGTASKKAFSIDDDGNVTATWDSVKNIGKVELVISPEGEVVGTAGIYEFSSDYDSDDTEDGVFTHGAHTFSVDVGDYDLNEDYSLVDETVPTEVEIMTSNSKTWNCGKTPSIKYKKVKEDGETSYVLLGIDDEVKTNYSGLKLKYNSKKGTFSGSFKVYATNEMSIEKGKPKLKSYSFSVSGNISGSTCTGVATCKKLKASWEVVID